MQRQFFDRLAQRYDARFLRARWPRNQEVKARHVTDVLGTAIESGPVVEVGCGTGQIAELLLSANPGLHYVGLDLSEPMLEIARSRLSPFADRAELRVVAGNDLPLEAESYAAAYGVDVLHHVVDPPALLRSLSTSLQPEAKVVFLEGNPKFPITTFMALTQREERGVLKIGFRNLREWLEGAGRVGVTAGASTPEFLVTEVVEELGHAVMLEPGWQRAADRLVHWGARRHYAPGTCARAVHGHDPRPPHGRASQ